jgi:hypothetical protein
MNATLRRLIPILSLVLFAGACAAPPVLKPLDPALTSAVSEGCQRPFLREPYRLVHSLEFDLPGGVKGAAIGVIEADPRMRRFRTVLMTLEGWVLFDIESGETLTVHRAVPPFDSPAFANRMAEDIGLAFFPPGETPLAWGRKEGRAPVCRFGRSDRGFVDVLQTSGGEMEIRLYDAGQKLRKTVLISSFNGAGLAEQLEVRSGGPSYTLRLRLIEGETVAREQGPSSGESAPKGP